ncbi:MAG: hypothetical protein AAFX09_07320 [Pseudomonadota bacterium]
MGAAFGLAAAVALAAACVVLLSGAAYGAQSDSGLGAALAECESAAGAPMPGASALGACDFALQNGGLDDAARAAVLANRGVIAMARGDADGAVRDLEMADELELGDGGILLNLAAALIKAGRHEDGAEAAREVIALGDAREADAWFNLAVAEESQGAYAAAYSAYVKATEADPDRALFAAQPARFLDHQPAG